MKLPIYKIILFLIIVMAISDAMNLYLKQYGFNYSYISASLFARGVILVLFASVLLRNKTALIYITITILFIGMYVLGSFVLAENNLSNVNYYRNVVVIIKMMYIFFIYILIYKYFTDESKTRKLFKIYEIIVLVYSVVSIASFIFNLTFFQAYTSGPRFGIRALMTAVNELSGFFVLAVFYFLNKAFISERKLQNYIALSLVVIGALLTGTKACVVFISIGLIAYFLRYIRLSAKRLFAAVFVLAILVGGAYSARDRLSESFHSTRQYFEVQHRHRIKIYEQSNPIGRYFSLIVSGRDIKVNKFIENVKPNWTFVNYLIGGWNYSRNTMEMDFADLFGMVGILGTLIYTRMYLFILFRNGKWKHYFAIVPLVSWLAISFFGGHLLFSAINSTYLVIFLKQCDYIKTKSNVTAA